MACRALIICLLCAAKGVWFILEQPHSSVMEYHPVFQSLAKLLRIHRFTMKMLDYGAPSVKRTHLYSSPLYTKKCCFGIVFKVFRSQTKDDCLGGLDSLNFWIPHKTGLRFECVSSNRHI